MLLGDVGAARAKGSRSSTAIDLENIIAGLQDGGKLQRMNVEQLLQ